MTRAIDSVPALCLILAACGASGLELPDEGSAPVDAPESARYYEDVAYADEGERQAFDLLHFPDAQAPTPLVIYIHGGGFTGGDKSAAWEGRAEFSAGLAADEVAVASCGYRLLEEVDTEGVIKPLTDSARCLQTLRHHAEQLNIDPTRVVLAGTSAGAGTALWLGSHDDLADSGAEDPVLAQSTRVDGVILWETQATYDLVRWNEVFLTDYGLDLFQTAADFGLEQRLLSFYGITDVADLESPDILAYRADVDMLALMDSSDAPIWVDNSVEGGGFPLGVGALFHHPKHALAVVQAATAAGIAVDANIPNLDEPLQTEVSASAFATGGLGL